MQPTQNSTPVKTKTSVIVLLFILIIGVVFVAGSRFDRLYPMQKAIGLGSRGTFTADVRGCTYSSETDEGGENTLGRAGFICIGTFTTTNGKSSQVKMIDNQVSFGGNNATSSQTAEGNNTNRLAYKPVWFRNEVVPDNSYESKTELGIFTISAVLVVLGVIGVTIYYHIKK